MEWVPLFSPLATQTWFKCISWGKQAAALPWFPCLNLGSFLTPPPLLPLLSGSCSIFPISHTSQFLSPLLCVFLSLLPLLSRFLPELIPEGWHFTVFVSHFHILFVSQCSPLRLIYGDLTSFSCAELSPILYGERGHFNCPSTLTDMAGVSKVNICITL